MVSRLFRWRKKALRLVTFIFIILGTLGSSQAVLAREFSYLSYPEAIVGLRQKEAKDLQKIFDDNKVVNLKKSELHELKAWLDQLNERLTKAIEQQGASYPDYRFYVMASNEPNAFVYKAQVPGHKTYRGHVFISTGLIQEMVENMGADLESITPEQMDRLLNGLTGVVAHEVTHPKQDELVKWEWRKSQNQSGRNHNQIDELSTDIMATKTLKQAELAPENMLTGLELVFGEEPERGQFAKRAARAMGAIHPQDNLRLNMIRGTLTHLRINEGKNKVRPLTLNFEKMKSELSAFSALNSAEGKLDVEIARMSGNRIKNILRHLQDELKKARDLHSNFDPIQAYVDHLDLLIREESSHGRLTNEEMAEFISFIDDLSKKGRVDLTNGHHDWWYDYHGGSGSGAGPAPEAVMVRKIQSRLKKIKAFQDSRFQSWLSSTLADDFWKFVIFNNQGVIYSFETLSFLLPKGDVEKLFREGLRISHTLPVEQRVYSLMRLWHGVSALGLAPDLETGVIRALSGLMTSDPASIPAFTSQLRNIFDADSIRSRVYFSEKFVRYLKTHPTETNELLNAYSQFLKEILKSPKLVSEVGRSISSNEKPLFKALIWALDPEYLLKETTEGHPVAAKNTMKFFEELFSSPAWKIELDRVANGFQAIERELESTNKSITLLDLDVMLLRDGFPLPDQDKIKIGALFLSPVTDVRNADQMAYAFYYLGESHAKPKMVREMALEFLKKISQTSGIAARDLLSDPRWRKLAMRNSIPSAIEFYQLAHVSGLLSKAELEELTRQALIFPPHGNVNYDLATADRNAAFQLNRTLATQGIKGRETLRVLIEQFELGRYDERSFPDLKWDFALKTEIQNAQLAGVKTLPRYGRVLFYIAPALEGDFRKEFGLEKDWSVTDTRYRDIFKSNFKEIAEYYQLIFNPDRVTLTNELKHLADYRALDELGRRFVQLIPNDGLTPEQYLALWRDMSAKRANRYTDQVFLSHVLPYLKRLSGPEARRLSFEFLEHGMIQSERYKVTLLEDVLSVELHALKNKVGQVSDAELSSLVEKIYRFTPESSRFRDDFLESTGWALELPERQLNKFIEPMKSFNYTSMDPWTLNRLSLLSVLSEKLSAEEKLRFIRYIQEPKGELIQVLPTLSKAVKDAKSYFSQMTGEYLDENKIRDLLEKLEAFIRDANESQRLVLNEILVGTRGHGLWFQGDKIKTKLFDLAGLDAERLRLFQAYLKALPKHEQTVALSYLLATKSSESTGPQLLRILELHKTPGYKFAQLASILNIFGEEQSRELAKAKDQSDPITRAQAFEQLKEVYNPSQYAQIRRVKKLAGSGGIKQVLLVEFDDGATEAVYLKRKHVDSTIDSTLELAQRFTQALRSEEDYAGKYEYDYYLESLKKQLQEETGFLRELKLTSAMIEKYKLVKPLEGWRFEPVLPSRLRPQSEDVLHFAAVENVVPFDKLSLADKKSVSKLIVSTELEFLLNDGVFDADRHMGNYLFDPKSKRIYPIDFAQVHSLTQTSVFKVGDPYYLAKIIYGLSQEDPKVGAKAVLEAIRAIIENPTELNGDVSARIEKKIANILAESKPLSGKLTSIMGVLTEQKLHLPTKYTLGIFKGLMIITNEEYAKFVESELIQNQMRQFVKRELVKGRIADCVGDFLKILGAGQNY